VWENFEGIVIYLKDLVVVIVVSTKNGVGYDCLLVIKVFEVCEIVG